MLQSDSCKQKQWFDNQLIDLIVLQIVTLFYILSVRNNFSHDYYRLHFNAA